MTIHALYRAFDRNDVLLYVGITNNPRGRMHAHMRSQHWARHIKYITFEHFSTREKLKAAERSAISTEFPAYNRTYANPVEPHSLQDVVDAGLAPSERWLRERLHRGDIPGIKVARHGRGGNRYEWRMTDADVEALVDQMRNRPQRQLTALTATSLRKRRAS
jgi:predicted GIY-YIG superfamily endonuclease